MKALALRLWSCGLAAMILLGWYKLVVAHAKGHSNVAFLYIMMIAGGLVFSGVCWTLPRLSHMGKAYLERLKVAFGGLKAQLDADGNWTVNGLEIAGARGKTRAAVACSDCLLLVGVFGISSLADTPLSDLNTMFTRSASSNGGCGGGVRLRRRRLWRRWRGCGGGCGGCGG